MFGLLFAWGESGYFTHGCLSLKCKVPIFGDPIWFFLFNSVWYENGSPYLQKQGILVIDLCLQNLVWLTTIWAYEYIRAGRDDDLISRWLPPTFWLELWSINKLNTEYVDSHRNSGFHRSWGYLLCLPVTYRYWSPAPRVNFYFTRDEKHQAHCITLSTDFIALI